MTKNKKIEYSGKYTSYTREQLVKKVKKMMSKQRFKHVLRVEQTALELAEKYGADAERVSIAALLHDYTKEQSNSEMHDLIISENLDLELLQYGSSIWHGPVGAILAQREFEIEDEDILNAIHFHTIGAPEMSLIEQIIYVADYIEPNRDFKGVEEARKLADKSLEKAVKYKNTKTMKSLVRREARIYPKALDAYNAWIAQ